MQREKNFPPPQTRSLLSLLPLLFLCAAVSFHCKKAVLKLGAQEYPKTYFFTGDKKAHRFWLSAKKAVIASDSKEASEAALQIFKKGGNIVDAAAALGFVISVARPQSTGLGGGGFLIMRFKDKTLAFDFRERAPLAAKADMYLDAQGKMDRRASLFGLGSVAVPGMVAGMLHIHKKYGKLPLKQIMAPAIELAAKGFHVYPDLARAIANSYKDMDEAMRAVFAPNNKVLKEGNLLIQKDLARALSLIAKKGRQAFYQGAIAQALVDMMAKEKGYITKADMRQYKVYARKPLWSQYRSYKIATMPLPSSGLFITGMLRKLNSQALAKLYHHERLRYYEELIKVLGWAYQERERYGGDPRFLKKIPRYETTHFSLMDNEGNALSSTQSINYRFGSHRMIKSWGIILNDTMDDFSSPTGQANVYGLSGSKANAIAPAKTPLSSMSPMLLFDQGMRVRLALGAPGGSHIISAILQTIIHSVDLGMHPFAAVARRRIHYQYKPDKVFIEANTMEAKLKSQLEQRGYHTQEVPRLRAKVFLTQDLEDPQDSSKRLFGASDPRGSGEAAGF